MPLSGSKLNQLIHLKNEIEELMDELQELTKDEFYLTCIVRYAGEDPDVREALEGSPMLWISDVHDDAIAAIEKHRDELES